ILPKYNKVLETRKTTEAEEILTAMREEEEFICMEKGFYESNLTRLNVTEGLNPVLNEPEKVESKYYKYGAVITGRLKDNEPSISATSSDGGYDIIIRLKDGSLSCVYHKPGDFVAACDNLSKDYPRWTPSVGNGGSLTEEKCEWN
ncbi:MAG: hypothetical protein J5601_03635, partial [Elusimicrobiaceae bacterium]|nr:hypothetical protein [Elusimicrobiaceae bacterium]